MKNIYDIYLGNILALRRKELGLTQTDVGVRFNLSKQLVCGYEKGWRSMNASLFFEMCDFLHLDADDVAQQVISMVKKDEQV